MEECVHAEDGCTASDIEDHLVLEQVLVVVDGVAIALGSHFVLEHFLVDAVVVVAVEVMRFAVCHARHGVTGRLLVLCHVRGGVGGMGEWARTSGKEEGEEEEGGGGGGVVSEPWEG